MADTEFMDTIRYLTQDMSPEELAHFALCVAEIACEKDVERFSLKMTELIVNEINLAIEGLPAGEYAEAAYGIGLSNAATQDYTQSLVSESVAVPKMDSPVDGVESVSWIGDFGEC